ncbi:MAG: FtsW/RodA/SpoVE family cell cycle protein, partial [Proteobacteria bacterium]|nr:FtsW/RodA/SpoVE family cell cycle protein [Pseudomonadota bacterium]
MFDRRLVQNFDWSLLGLALILGFFGLVTLYSAVTAGTQAPQMEYYKQLIWYFVGLIFLIISFLFNYKTFDRWGYIIYILCISLLVGVLILGEGSKGAMRWLRFGFFSIQPSEPVKIAVIIILARYYSKHTNTAGLTLRELINPFLLTIIPFILIVKQPAIKTTIMAVPKSGCFT